MNTRRHLLASAVGALGLAALPGFVRAQTLETARILVGFPAGGTVDAVARRLADKLNGKAPNVLSSIKELINEAHEQPLNSHLKMERDRFVRNLHHANGGEGIQAFLDKRAPNYR